MSLRTPPCEEEEEETGSSQPGSQEREALKDQSISRGDPPERWSPMSAWALAEWPCFRGLEKTTFSVAEGPVPVQRKGTGRGGFRTASERCEP